MARGQGSLDAVGQMSVGAVEDLAEQVPEEIDHLARRALLGSDRRMIAPPRTSAGFVSVSGVIELPFA